MVSSVLWLFILIGCALNAESLGTVLTRAGVPTASIPSPELHQEITSFAINSGNPFLLAYYESNGTSILSVPLHVFRYDRSRNLLATTAIRKIDPSFSDLGPLISGNCLGSALGISEKYGRIYIDTHINPSAGCVLVFSRHLSLEATFSGALVAVLDSNYTILEENEIHFASVNPLRLKAINF